MRKPQWTVYFLVVLSTLALATSSGFANSTHRSTRAAYDPAIYEARLPSSVTPSGRNVIIFNPRLHAWGAYNAAGQLVRGGQASGGASWCPDLGRSCRTRSGTFYINSLGSAGCKSSIFPLGRGGAPMPYCMFFNKGQAFHGSYQVVDGNVSHGCVRLHVQDAEWLRFNLAAQGTKVVVLPY